MRVIEPGKFVTSLIRCPRCEALLEVNAGDVSFLSLTDRAIVCEECKSAIFVKKNDDDIYEVIKKED